MYMYNMTHARAHTHTRIYTCACLLAHTRMLTVYVFPQIVEGKFRKLVDGVVDYDWKGF